MLLNASFNENEPIVHRPEEALDCFLRTRMDVLVMGPYVVEKSKPTREPADGADAVQGATRAPSSAEPGG